MKLNKIDDRGLSILALTTIPAILFMPLFMDTILIVIPAVFCLIGGLSFGALVARTRSKN